MQDESRPERETENVPVTTYSSAGGQTPMAVLPMLIRQYPDVIIVRELADLETLTLLCEQVEEDRLVMFGVRAKEAVEALLRILMLKIPPADFAQVVTGVLNVRLVRLLCETCKEAYPPPPEVLKQLGLPAGKIENLYRTPTQPIDPKHPEVVCDKCNGVGYFGRTAIFELLTVNDTLRQALASTPKLDILRQVARKAKHRTLQEEGVLLVARGVTSIQELLRASSNRSNHVSEHPAHRTVRGLLRLADDRRAVEQYAGAGQRADGGVGGDQLLRAVGRLVRRARASVHVPLRLHLDLADFRHHDDTAANAHGLYVAGESKVFHAARPGRRPADGLLGELGHRLLHHGHTAHGPTGSQLSAGRISTQARRQDVLPAGSRSEVAGLDAPRIAGFPLTTEWYRAVRRTR